jgi:hypothetical protein
MNTGWKRLQHEQRAKVAQRMLFAEHTGYVNNRGSPLFASGNSSYQILRFPNAPAAMMLMRSPPGICSDFYVLKCVRRYHLQQSALPMPFSLLPIRTDVTGRGY